MKNTIKVVVWGFVIMIGIILSGFGFIRFKETMVRNSVMTYLIDKKHLSKQDIISVEPCIANLPGSRNWQVSVRLKNDEKTYYYYKNENGKVILESYNENGIETYVGE